MIGMLPVLFIRGRSIAPVFNTSPDSVTISPVRDANGKVLGASKIARDISERKRTEQKLRDNARQLQTYYDQTQAEQLAPAIQQHYARTYPHLTPDTFVVSRGTTRVNQILRPDVTAREYLEYINR